MNRRYHNKRGRSETTGPDVTTFMNLMVVLIPFFLDNVKLHIIEGKEKKTKK